MWALPPAVTGQFDFAGARLQYLPLPRPLPPRQDEVNGNYYWYSPFLREHQYTFAMALTVTFSVNTTIPQYIQRLIDAIHLWETRGERTYAATKPYGDAGR